MKHIPKDTADLKIALMSYKKNEGQKEEKHLSSKEERRRHFSSFDRNLGIMYPAALLLWNLQPWAWAIVSISIHWVSFCLRETKQNLLAFISQIPSKCRVTCDHREHIKVRELRKCPAPPFEELIWQINLYSLLQKSRLKLSIEKIRIEILSCYSVFDKIIPHLGFS